jgi:hypothetical protein
MIIIEQAIEVNRPHLKWLPNLATDGHGFTWIDSDEFP